MWRMSRKIPEFSLMTRPSSIANMVVKCHLNYNKTAVAIPLRRQRNILEARGGCLEGRPRGYWHQCAQGTVLESTILHQFNFEHFSNSSMTDLIVSLIRNAPWKFLRFGEACWCSCEAAARGWPCWIRRVRESCQTWQILGSDEYVSPICERSDAYTENFSCYIMKTVVTHCHVPA